MKKIWSTVIWVIVTMTLFTLAYTVYEKNKAHPGTGGFKNAEGVNAEGADTTPKILTDTSQIEERIMAPDFTLTDLDGKKVKLSDYRGKVVFLNFWATWCPPCQDEMPDMEKANEELSRNGKGVILAVNVLEDRDKVKKFLKDNKLDTLHVLLDDKNDVAGDTYKVSGYPTTYIINSDGTFFNKHVGPLNKDTILHIIYKAK